jgi:hypothetical protein
MGRKQARLGARPRPGLRRQLPDPGLHARNPVGRTTPSATRTTLWDPDKLDVALAWVTSIPAHIPAVYGARTRLIDEDDGVIGLSPLFPHPMSFANAIVQSVAGGNTMVFNHAARALLMEAGPDLDIQTHDWWLYILATGCGGLLHYDPVPKVGYRQHPNNIVGSNIGWMPRLRRAYRLLIGRFRSMNDRNFAALRRVRHRMSPEALAVLDEFERARHAWLLPRIIGIRKSGVYLQDHHRQSRPDCRDAAQEAVSAARAAMVTRAWKSRRRRDGDAACLARPGRLNDDVLSVKSPQSRALCFGVRRLPFNGVAGV